MGRTWTDLGVFIGKRLALLIPVVFGVITITFFFTHVIVSDPCTIWLGAKANHTTIAACIKHFGFDQPIPVQYYRYLQSLVSGNFGSNALGAPVLPVILAAFPATLELVIAAIAIMVAVGIPLGVVAAASNGRAADHLVRVFYLSGWATPTYLAAALLAIGVAPIVGITTGEFTSPPTFPRPTHMSVVDAFLAGNGLAAWDAFTHVILPASALAFLNLGLVTRMTRTAMLESLPMDFVKTARMKGLGEGWVLYKHALRHSLITTTTVIGLTAGYLLGATVVVEKIFEWPGIGDYAYNAITSYNFDGTIAVVIFLAIGVVIANLIADILYGVLDPRVEWR